MYAAIHHLSGFIFGLAAAAETPATSDILLPEYKRKQQQIWRFGSAHRGRHHRPTNGSHRIQALQPVANGSNM